VSASCVLLFSLGPVQAFIASGRRCRDLWYGSTLLSDLAAEAALAVERVAGEGALVFPGGAVNDILGKASVANRVLVRVPGDLALAERVALAAKDAVNSKLDAILREAFDRVGRGDPQRDQHFHREVAEAQVADLIEVQWAAVEEGNGGYDRARKRVDRILAQRKNSRTWGPSTWAAAVPKSSLDGALESVLDESLYDGGLSSEELYKRYRAHASERLSGVDLLKRFGRRGSEGANDWANRWEERFFSTSHMAALSWMVGVGRQGDAYMGEAVQRYVEALRQLGPVASADLQVAPRPTEGFGRADGGLLFEGRLDDLAQEAGADDAKLDAARSALRGVIRRGRSLGCGEPGAYYAVLTADGDHMGRLIDSLLGHEAHQQLSRKLVEFASQARRAVEAHQGSTLYAGGDDVMAFLPLHTALQCAEELHRAFGQAVGELAAQAGVASALSVGVAVAHHLSPLDETLQLARSAEMLAKQSRDSLAVVVDKRGGATLEVSGRWNGDDAPGHLALHQRLERFVQAHIADDVSDKTAFELDALRWVGAHGAADMQGVLAAEVERILARKRSQHGEGSLDRAWLESAGLAADPARLGRELILARVFAAARRQASPNAPAVAGAAAQEVSP